MEAFAHLWLPILVSAAAVWVASAVIWMALPHHASDWKGLPDEAAFTSALKSLNLPTGVYGFPHCTARSQRNDPEFQKRWKEGPTGLLNLWPNNMSMGKNMVLSFLVYLVVSALIAYLGAAAEIPHGASFAKVFQILGTAGVLAYAFAMIPNGIWFNAGARAITMNFLDGVVYGLVTGAVFAWLWPAASVPGIH